MIVISKKQLALSLCRRTLHRIHTKTLGRRTVKKYSSCGLLCSDTVVLRVGYQRFGGLCCLHLQGEVGRWYPTATLYSITTQKTSNWIFTALKTPNLACKEIGREHVDFNKVTENGVQWRGLFTYMWPISHYGAGMKSNTGIVP